MSIPYLLLFGQQCQLFLVFLNVCTSKLKAGHQKKWTVVRPHPPFSEIAAVLTVPVSCHAPTRNTSMSHVTKETTLSCHTYYIPWFAVPTWLHTPMTTTKYKRFNHAHSCIHGQLTSFCCFSAPSSCVRSEQFFCKSQQPFILPYTTPF